MEAVNNLKKAIREENLLACSCCVCDKFFTGENYKDDNWEIYFRTDNGIDWTNFKEGKNRGWIRVEIELQHIDCQFKYSPFPWGNDKK